MSTFGEMHSLESVSLANNSLRHLPREVFQPIIESVQVIDVHGKFANFIYTSKIPLMDKYIKTSWELKFLGKQLGFCVNKLFDVLQKTT